MRKADLLLTCADAFSSPLRERPPRLRVLRRRRLPPPRGEGRSAQRIGVGSSQTGAAAFPRPLQGERWRGRSPRRRGGVRTLQFPSLVFSKHLLGDKPARKHRRPPGGARCLRQLPPVRSLPMIYRIIGLPLCGNRLLTPRKGRDRARHRHRVLLPACGAREGARHRPWHIRLHRHARLRYSRLAIVKELAPVARIAARSRWALSPERLAAIRLGKTGGRSDAHLG